MTVTCPNCGRRFDPARDRWRRAGAAEGRVPGWLWSHSRPDNGRSCPYVDAGPLPVCTSATGGAMLHITEDPDAQDQARMAG